VQRTELRRDNLLNKHQFKRAEALSASLEQQLLVSCVVCLCLCFMCFLCVVYVNYAFFVSINSSELARCLRRLNNSCL
jgi:hypothetical protein